MLIFDRFACILEYFSLYNIDNSLKLSNDLQQDSDIIKGKIVTRCIYCRITTKKREFALITLLTTLQYII